MAKLEWDKTGQRFFESGVDHGVIYVEGKVDGAQSEEYKKEGYMYGKAAVWNGLTSVTDSPSGADETALWADNIKYASLRAAEEFGITIEAYQSPAEFDECDGTATPNSMHGVFIRQQKRKTFGFVYRTNVQNDTGTDADDGYKLHICYGLTASPSEQTHDTINDSPDASTLSWECTSNPVDITGYKPTSCIVIDSTKITGSDHLADLEKVLFGDEQHNAFLPLPDDVIKILKDGLTSANIWASEAA